MPLESRQSLPEALQIFLIKLLETKTTQSDPSLFISYIESADETIIAALTNSKSDDLETFLHILSEKHTTGDTAGTTQLYWWMAALSWATEKNPSAVSKILSTFNALIAASKKSQKIMLLLQGLSEKHDLGISAGITGSQWLIAALSWASEKNPALATDILNSISQLITACGTPQQVTKLLQGLSEKSISGSVVGATGLYWLMLALSWLAEKNSVAVTQIADIIGQLIIACELPEQITQLLQGLSEKRSSGEMLGVTGLYQLMASLSLAVKKNLATTPAILVIINQFILSCKTSEHITQLLQGLSEKRTSKMTVGTTGLDLWVETLFFAIEKNSTEAMRILASITHFITVYFSHSDFSNKALLIVLLNTLSMQKPSEMIRSESKKIAQDCHAHVFHALEKNKTAVSPDTLIFLKKELRHTLRDYLKIADLKTLLSIMNNENVLMRVIICRTDGQQEKKSSTQEYIEELVKTHIQKNDSRISFSALLTPLKKEIKLKGKHTLLFEDVITWLDHVTDLHLLLSIETQLNDAISSSLIDEIRKICRIIRNACPELMEALSLPVCGVVLDTASSSDAEVFEGTVVSDTSDGDSKTKSLEETAVVVSPPSTPLKSEKKEAAAEAVCQPAWMAVFFPPISIAVNARIRKTDDEDILGEVTHKPMQHY